MKILLPTSPMSQVLLWMVPALVGLGLLVGLRAKGAPPEPDKGQTVLPQPPKVASLDTVEVLSFGFSLERLKEQTLWDQLRKLPPHASLLSENPKDYPFTETEKWETFPSRSGMAYARAIEPLVEKWEIPFIQAAPPIQNPEMLDLLRGKLYATQTGGLHYHRLRSVNQTYDACSDHLVQDVFALLEQYSDLPVMGLGCQDSIYMRNLLRPAKASSIIKEGRRQPGEVTDSTCVLLLGRRERVDLLRPTAIDVAIKDLDIPSERVLNPRIPFDEDRVRSYDETTEPQVKDRDGVMRPWWAVKFRQAANFWPSRYVKRPWCKEQIKQFDALRVIALLHRPQEASFLRDGEPLPPKARAEAFQEAWKRALATLPAGQAPVRVVYDAGPGRGAQIALLCQALHALGPDLEVPGKDALDVFERCGDVGANSAYASLGLGILATQHEGGITAVVCLRRDDRATITMVSPASSKPEGKRLSGRLPIGTVCPSNSQCPEPGVWQCAHAQHADGRLRRFRRDEWFPEALLLRRTIFGRQEDLLDTTWTLMAYPEPTDAGEGAPESGA